MAAATRERVEALLRTHNYPGPGGVARRTRRSGLIDLVLAGLDSPWAVEILRGGRSKVVQKHSYDGLPGYGAYAHLRNEDVLERVDALIASGRLRSTGGAYPKLQATAQASTLADGVAA